MEQYNVKVAPNGRMVIPSAVRAALGVSAGGDVILRVEDGSVRMETLDDAIRRAQELVARYVPADISLTDELSADRRSEAANE